MLIKIVNSLLIQQKVYIHIKASDLYCLGSRLYAILYANREGLNDIICHWICEKGSSTHINLEDHNLVVIRQTRLTAFKLLPDDHISSQ